jgi:hypothetical protein
MAGGLEDYFGLDACAVQRARLAAFLLELLAAAVTRPAASVSP